MMARVKWKGIEKGLSKMVNASSRIDVLRGQAVKNATEKVGKLARQYAPEDTGFLKRYIKTEHPVQGVGVVREEAGYSGYQEYGTRYQPGKPHLRPAIKEVTPQLKKDLDDVVRGAFK